LRLNGHDKQYDVFVEAQVLQDASQGMHSNPFWTDIPMGHWSLQTESAVSSNYFPLHEVHTVGKPLHVAQLDEQFKQFVPDFTVNKGGHV